MTSKEQKILFLGSGFVAGPCLNLLLKRPENKITIACRHLETAKELGGNRQNCTAISLDANNQQALDGKGPLDVELFYVYCLGC